MKIRILLILLALIPTHLAHTAVESYYGLEGLWYDDYSGKKVEIKESRKWIKVREHKSLFKKKWKKYYRMGTGLYDDCHGSLIVVLDHGALKWKRRGNRQPYILSRYDHYDRRGRQYSNHDSYFDNYDRGYSDRSSRYSRESYCGDWYCSDKRLNLEIKPYGDNGFRARSGRKDWTYYQRYGRNDYRDRRGNRYHFEEDRLCWSSYNGRNKLYFNLR